MRLDRQRNCLDRTGYEMHWKGAAWQGIAEERHGKAMAENSLAQQSKVMAKKRLQSDGSEQPSAAKQGNGEERKSLALNRAAKRWHREGF